MKTLILVMTAFSFGLTINSIRLATKKEWRKATLSWNATAAILWVAKLISDSVWFQ